MIKRTGILALLAACGGKAASTSTVSNEQTPEVPADGVIRLDTSAPTKDCPAGALDALGEWEWIEEEQTPGLDSCLRGNLIGDSVLVYASAQPPPDSQSEVGYPARRVILGLDGKFLLEGPPDGGDWMVGQGWPIGLVDLDGDGVHEILEGYEIDPMTQAIRVFVIADQAMVEAGTVITSMDQGDDYGCTAKWEVGPVAANGRRPLVVDVETHGELDYGGYGGEDIVTCPDTGKHQLWLEDGMLADDYEQEPTED